MDGPKPAQPEEHAPPPEGPEQNPAPPPEAPEQHPAPPPDTAPPADMSPPDRPVAGWAPPQDQRSDGPVVGWAPPQDQRSDRPVVGWAAPDDAPGPRFTAGAVVGRTFAVFGREWSLFIAIAAPAALVTAIQLGFVPPEDVATNLALIAISAVVSLFTTAATALATDAVDGGRDADLGRVVREGLSVMPRMLLLVLALAAAFLGFAFLAILVLALVTASPQTALIGLIGFLVLIPLLIWVAVRLYPVFAIVALEPTGPIQALRRAWAISRGRAITLFAIAFVIGLATSPASIGAGLLALEPGVPAAIGYGLAILITTPVSVIALTLAYRGMAGAPGSVGTSGHGAPADVRAADAADARRHPVPGRALGFTLVLGLGVVLMLARFGVAGGRLTELVGGIEDPGVIVAGLAEGVTDPCRPANPVSTFGPADEIWLGGYFERPVSGGTTANVVLRVNGDEILDEPLIAPEGFFPAFCYYEEQPITDAAPGEYEVEIVYEGEVIASGGFTVTE